MWATLAIVLCFLSSSVAEEVPFVPPGPQNSNCTRGCSFNGVCDPSGTCQCNEGWQGAGCDEPTCTFCSGHAHCLNGYANQSSGPCGCFPGYEGPSCDVLRCVPGSAACCDSETGSCYCNDTETGVCANGEAPDLMLNDGRVNPTLEWRVFTEDDCALSECVTKTGLRRILRFNTEARNIGTADLFVGHPSQSFGGLFHYHSCHNHFHMIEFVRVSLLLKDSEDVSAVTKIGFCVQDSAPFDSNKPKLYNCQNQGLSAGWIDWYPSTLDCQWVDVTDIEPNDGLVLQQVINPHGLINESNYDNNAILTRLDCGGACTLAHQFCDFVQCRCTQGWAGSECDTCAAGYVLVREECVVAKCQNDTVKCALDSEIGMCQNGDCKFPAAVTPSPTSSPTFPAPPGGSGARFFENPGLSAAATARASQSTCVVVCALVALCAMFRA